MKAVQALHCLTLWMLGAGKAAEEDEDEDGEERACRLSRGGDTFAIMCRLIYTIMTSGWIFWVLGGRVMGYGLVWAGSSTVPVHMLSEYVVSVEQVGRGVCFCLGMSIELLKYNVLRRLGQRMAAHVQMSESDTD